MSGLGPGFMAANAEAIRCNASNIVPPSSGSRDAAEYADRRCEMREVLKPGGLLVFIDSLDCDRPAYDGYSKCSRPAFTSY